jgi:DNA polymerase III epsilon subunit-like protein
VSLRAWLSQHVLRGRLGPAPDLRRLAEMRFAVVDVDVSGTDIHDDRVTGIAVLPVVSGAFRISDLRYCPLANAPDAPANPESTGQSRYLAVHDLVAGSPIVTYNPRFVREMIWRACRFNGLPPLEGEWVDLASAVGVVDSEESELTSMDCWLEKMKTGAPEPHDAVYDVFAMAQLLLVVVAHAEEVGIDTFEALARSQDARTWLHGG